METSAVAERFTVSSRGLTGAGYIYEWRRGIRCDGGKQANKQAYALANTQGIGREVHGSVSRSNGL